VFQFSKYIQLPLNETNFTTFSVQNLSNNAWFGKLTSLTLNSNLNLPMYLTHSKAQLLPTTFMPDQTSQLSLLTTLPSSFNWVTKRLFLVNSMSAQKINLLPKYTKSSNQPTAKRMSLNFKWTGYENLFTDPVVRFAYTTSTLPLSAQQFVVDGPSREWFTLNNVYFSLNATKIINNFRFIHTNNLGATPYFSFIKPSYTDISLRGYPLLDPTRSFDWVCSLLDLTLSTNCYNADFFYFTKL
jgi:hypothetical protein